jgi:hypothetical protein
VKTIARSGRYYRVCDPDWPSCMEATYAARFGGRWNPPDSYPTLYLNRDIETARANARRTYEGEAFGLFDLNPVARPHLQIVELEPCKPVDAVTEKGLLALGLPADFPTNTPREICQPIGKQCHDAGAPGIAARSAAHENGEELALFTLDLARKGQRIAFVDWYIDQPLSP